MSVFANNIEAMGFDKSGWALIETSADGNTIYMGKPMTADAKPDEPVWTLKCVATAKNENGNEFTQIQFAYKCKWDERASKSIKWKYF